MTIVNYWDKVTQARLSRRRLLQTGAAAGASAAALSLIGCGGGSSSGGGASGQVYTPADSTSKVVKGGIFPQSFATDILSFDDQNGSDSTAAMMGMSRLAKYETVKYPKAAEPNAVPDAALSWETSPDGMTVTFKLRPNFKYDPRPPTNNRAMTAADVVWSWNHFDQTNPMAPNLSNRSDPTGPVLSATAVDNLTVAFKLAFPYAPLVPSFAYSRHMSIFPVEADGKYDIRSDMRGTAGWRLKTYVPSNRIEYVKNPDWYDADKVYLDGMTNFLISEYATGLAQFTTGAIGAYGVNQEDILTIKREHAEILMRQNDGFTPNGGGWIRFNYQPGSPFLDDRVRKAVSALIDRDLIISTFFSTKGFTDAGLDAPIRWNTAIGAGQDQYWLDPKDQKAFGENAKFFAFDPNGAKQLMTAAGFTKPVEQPFIIESTANQTSSQKGSVIIDMLNTGGLFNIKQTILDYRTDFRPNVLYGSDKHQGMGYRGSTGEDYPDVDGYLQAWWISGKDRTGHVMANGKPDTHLDDLVAKQRVETDQQKRVSLLHELQQYAAGTMYLLMDAGSSPGYQMANPWVGNWEYFRSTSGGVPWNESQINWWIDKSKQT